MRSRGLLLAVSGALAMVAASAGATTPMRGIVGWSAGWDVFTEPLDFQNSNVLWSLDPATRKLTMSFALVNATPNKLYQMTLHFYCKTFTAKFGNLPNNNARACPPITRQGVTKTITEVDFGVVLTDQYGNGKVDVDVGAVLPGTYSFSVIARNGAGCGLTGGGGNSSNVCEGDFQSPGPNFGDATTIVVP